MTMESGQWVDVPQYSPPVMARPAGFAINDLASNGTVIAIGLVIMGAILAIVFLGAVKDAACSCKGK